VTTEAAIFIAVPFKALPQCETFNIVHRNAFYAGGRGWNVIAQDLRKDELSPSYD